MLTSYINKYGYALELAGGSEWISFSSDSGVKVVFAPV
jgi:hypothetical protein